MRIASWISLLSCLVLGGIAAACSSDDSSGTTSGDYAPAGNGQPVGEKAACDALRAAEDARSTALSCGPITRPACPGYISAGHDACSQYDQGALSACIDWVGKQTCDGLKKHKCIVKVLPGTAPNGCPVVDDSGTDAPEDTGSDAPEDTGSDAGADATDDATDDAASDAPDDSASEAAADATSD